MERSYVPFSVLPKLTAPPESVIVEFPSSTARLRKLTAPLAVILLRRLIAPALGPALSTVSAWATMLRKVMSPLVVLVLPAPFLICKMTSPVPALMLMPLAMVIAAAPASRFAFTTPSAAVAFA